MKPAGEKYAIPDGWQNIALRNVLELDQPGAWGDDPTPDKSGVRVLRATDLTRDGRVNPDKAAYRRLSLRDLERRVMQDGDLILERSGGGPGTPVGRVALVEGLGSVYCNNFCQQLRIDRTQCTPKYAALASAERLERAEPWHSGIDTRRELRQGSNIKPQAFETWITPLIWTSPSSSRPCRSSGPSPPCWTASTTPSRAPRRSSPPPRTLRDALLHDLLTRGLPGQHTEWRDVPGLGTIPADWEVVRLGDVAEVKGGKRLPKGAPFAEENTGFPYIRVVDFENRTVNTKDIRFLRAGDQRAISRYTINSADVYISIAGTIGLVGTIPDSLDGANLTENAAKIVVSRPTKLSQSCLSSYLNSLSGQSQITLRINVLGQPKLALERIRTIEVPLPPLSEQQAIASALEGVDAAIEVARKEMEGLRLLKETTADALLTGRMRISSLNSTARHWLHRQS